MATNGFHPNCKALLPHPRRGGEALDLLGSPVGNSAALATRVSPTCRGLSAHRAAHSARQPSPGPRCCSSPKTPAIASSTCIDPTLPTYELVQRLRIRLVRRRVPHKAGPFAPGPFVGLRRVRGAPNDGGKGVFPVRDFQALQTESPASSVDFAALRRPPGNQAKHGVQVPIDRVPVPGGLTVVPEAANPLQVLPQRRR
jgi:hypothetical protein